MLIILAFMYVTVFLVACTGGSMEKEKPSLRSIKSVDDSALKRLSGKKIYFGHQSIGSNILDGIDDVMRDNPKVRLKIRETENPEDYKASILGHSAIGKNNDPRSKCDHFVELMENGLGGNVEVAFFKFCCVDIMAESNVTELFSYYKEKMEYIKNKFPEVTFIHVTIPLTIVQSGPKAWIKKMMGLPLGYYDDNVKRNEYNNMLKKTYSGKEPVFDIAEIQSTLPDGRRVDIEKGGNIIYYLAPQYTNDGGHLNDLGRRIVAEQLLITLAELPR